ncbi:phosphatase PAP2 family protein [Streptacidiphilus pinicola]|uniref:phosphatase PAP2 family protein n=1 Tax=Streptacidiphilus pinicola TaxID=2219663 RepID=UPI001FB3F75F|nr:phosphatase PAP2 family protein [Streptacidiphilus pinicola]
MTETRSRPDVRATPPPALPASLRAPLGLAAALGALVVVLLGVVSASHSEPGRVDTWVQPASTELSSPWRTIALALDFLGQPVGAVLLVGVLAVGCLPLRGPRAAALVVVGAGLTVVTTTLLKHLVGRTIHGDNLSYPSGHTALLTALALAVALPVTGRARLGRTAGTLLVLTAALVAGAAAGWAQVSLGAHYPTDALAGWCTALTVLPATAWLIDRTVDAARPGRR